jgi:hypothetical protein
MLKSNNNPYNTPYNPYKTPINPYNYTNYNPYYNPYNYTNNNPYNNPYSNNVINIAHSIDENGDFYTVEFLAMGVERIIRSKNKGSDI